LRFCLLLPYADIQFFKFDGVNALLCAKHAYAAGLLAIVFEFKEWGAEEGGELHGGRD
jgi:hypothetical protein